MTIKINGTNTTAQPSITGTDTDTGLVYGTDEVKIVTGGTDRVKVDGSGILLVNAAAAGSKSSNAPLNVVSGSGGWGQTLRNRSNNDYAFQAFNSHDNSEQLASIALQRTGTNSGDLFFSTNGGNASATERMRILSSGGLTFNGDTATANALDDYEEGAFTPSYSSSGAHSWTPGTGNNGYYTKVGNLVTVCGTLHWTNFTYSGTLYLDGFPYTSTNLANYRIAGIFSGSNSGAYTPAGYNELVLAMDPNMARAFVVAVNHSVTSGTNYTHSPGIPTVGSQYGFFIQYMTQ